MRTMGGWYALVVVASIACGGPAALADDAGKAAAKKPVRTAAQAHHPATGHAAKRRVGKASVYHDHFQGRKTATGEIFSQHKLTAASRDLPLGSKATVTNRENGKSVDVEVNDRGPYVDGRVIDLSKTAAKQIGVDKQGVVPVIVEAKPPE